MKFAALGLAVFAAACAPVDAQTSLSNASQPKYKFELTPRSAHDCGTIHLIASEGKATSDPERSREHGAMSMAWFTTVALLESDAFSDQESGAMTGAILERLGASENPSALANELMKPCEVMSTLYRSTYMRAVEIAEEGDAALFADGAAFKRQVDGEIPEAPTKELQFADWTFFARGNLCIAAKQFDDGARLMFRFTNFHDGSISFEWDGLPMMDAESDEYDVMFDRHREGIDVSGDIDSFTEGVNYANFPGTSVFVDEKPLTVLIDGQTDKQDYRFGAGIQSMYYTRLPTAREFSIKVLGKETHRIRIDNAQLWNEMSECVAQYPFG